MMNAYIAIVLVLICKYSNAYLFRENDEDLGGQCRWNPCLNGGSCTSHPEKYYCSCKPGWNGDNCERRSNCFPNPCQHGICSPNIEGFTCTCRTGYKGPHCDILDHCHPNPCNNNGQCTETSHGVQCECAVGFKGKLCELEAKCKPINPCLNDGVCQEFLAYYQCTCPKLFRGENCEAYVHPTRKPPTIPIKYEGPQAIPVPNNVATNDIHEVITSKYIDSAGNVVSTSHESVSPGNENFVNSGGALVPHPGNIGEDSDHVFNHPVAISSEVFQAHNPFVGAPANDNFIVYSADEGKSKGKATGFELGRDDRYQTHLVQVNKDSNSHSGVHIGKAIPKTGEAISPENSNPHPEDNNADKVLSENKLHHEKLHENEAHFDHNNNHDNTQIHKDEEGLHSDDKGHESKSDSSDAKDHNDEELHLKSTQMVVVEPIQNSYAREGTGHERSHLSKNPVEAINLKYNSDVTKSNNSKPLNNASRAEYNTFKNNTVKNNGSTISDTKQDIGGEYPLSKETEGEKNKANDAIEDINNKIQDKMLKIKEVNNFWETSFAQQKDAYTTWRKKALINFHKRNPKTPLPKNTLSVSNNSLCPGFCRLFCDPWCTKIGCCKTSEKDLKMYKHIEEERDKKVPVVIKKILIKRIKPVVKDVHPCPSCNENADCVKSKCVCKTGFHGDGKQCSVDNCLLCHMDANCFTGRCICKSGFFGDGYECKENKYKRVLCSQCHEKADCISGDCFCARGFYGNGKNCWPLPITKK